MLTFIPASDPTEPLVAEYGLGVGKFNLKLAAQGNSRLSHLEHYGHSGDVIGYDAMMIYLPEHHATVVALFNENATIGFTAGPLLEVVDRNLSVSNKYPETFFRIAFWFLFGGLIVMQIYFASRVHRAGERVKADRKAIEREGWGYVVVRIIGSLALITFLVLYAINPTWLGVLSVPFPNWLRWVGVALGCASFGLYSWAQATLGKEWSPHLQMREEHHLVTTGPYARMRHPIYTAYMVFMTSIALVTANWFFVALFVVSVIVLALRIPKEEQMLTEVFGEEYKAYMRRTGGLFPK
jgi:protein-S-isoprenylcysteine O-methyltransferase Ste14